MSNTDTMKEVYLLAQEHCGLKVGDWVKIIRKAESNEAGWEANWNDNMDKYVGRNGFIRKFEDAYGMSVIFQDGNCWNFPYFVLKKVEKPAHQFKPFDKVLVRDSVSAFWICDFFSYYHKDQDNDDYPYRCLTSVYKYCIPYEGNEHLIGTKNSPE